MQPDPTRGQRLTSLFANSLTALCLPLLVYELDRSRIPTPGARYAALLALTVIFAVAWPVAVARSRMLHGFSRPLNLSVAIPCGVSTLAAAVLVFLQLWPLAYDVSGIVSLAVQLALLVLFFLPRKAESSATSHSAPGDRCRDRTEGDSHSGSALRHRKDGVLQKY